MRAFVVIVAIKSPHSAHHDDAAHSIVPIIADIKKTQVRASVRTFEADVIVKDQFGQTGDILTRFNVDLAQCRRAIAQRAEGPFHVDDAPVIGGQFNFG